MESPIIDDNKLLHSSYLYKRSKSHNWQRRWFVLRSNQLSYYKDSKEHKASKVINISDILSIAIIPDHHRFHFIVVTNKRIFHLRCSDELDFHIWIEQLNDVYKEYDKKFESQKEESQLEKLYLEDDLEYFKPVNINDIDFTNFHLSGTDDNFTSGPDSNNNVTYPSLQQDLTVQIPTAIQEERGEEIQEESEEEEEEDVRPRLPFINTELPISNDQSTPITSDSPLTNRSTITYYNSFSSNQPEHTITSGSLYRLKRRYNKWRKYHVVLTNRAIYFYKSIKDQQQGKIHKQINLKDLIDVVELDPLSKTKIYCMLIITAWKRIRFCAEDEESLIGWIVYLKTVIQTREKEIIIKK